MLDEKPFKLRKRLDISINDDTNQSNNSFSYFRVFIDNVDLSTCFVALVVLCFDKR